MALLEPQGFLVINHWTGTPPRGSLRLFATVIEALKESGVQEPGSSVAWIRSWNTATLLIKRGELTMDELERIRQFAETRGFDLAWLPGLSEDEVNRHQLLPRPYFYQAARALLSASPGAYIEDYQYDIAPVRDDNPYFNDHFRWKSLPAFLAIPGRGGIAMIDAGYPTLLVTLLQALLAAVVLILLPLLFLEKAPDGAERGKLRILVYFVAIGLAFLFVEISFIEAFTLIIGQPLYAVAVTLSLFLVFSGLGSLRVQHLVEKRGQQAIPGLLFRSVFAIILLSILYVVLRSWLIESVMALPETARILSALLLSAPLAFAMGMPFPLGLTATGRSIPRLLPWAWGINGCASVLSAILAVLLAMEIGFSGVMLSAAILYLVAWRSLPGIT